MKTLFEYDPLSTDEFPEDAYDNALDELHKAIKKTGIKKGFLTILNGGWKKQRGMTEIFELTAQNLFSKILGETDGCFKMQKEGHTLSFIRFSHDEPTGATIILQSSKWYNMAYKQIFGGINGIIS